MTEQAALIVGRSYKVTTDGDLEPAPDPGPILASIRRSFRFLVTATVVAYLALGGIAFYTYSTASENQQAVCNLRADLEHRVEASEEFLTEHPDTIRELGFTKAQVQKEINNQRRTLAALEVVSCG